MVTFTPEALERIEVDRRERTRRLASQAAHFTTERDTIAGGWIVRNPRIPGRIELVSPAGECSCSRYCLWDRCKHSALVEERHGIRY